MGALVTVRTYADVVQAELGRADLGAEGIPAAVIEGAGTYNPILGAAMGVDLRVDEADAERADAVLRRTERARVDDDDEAEGTVRCPRCELAYCSLERPRFSLATTRSPLVVALAMPFAAFGPKRWHCHKCEHVWDDAKAGPPAMTPLDPEAPRPVFRLRRAHAGMGLFLGLMAGLLSALLLGGARAGQPLAAAGGVALVAWPVLGWLAGRRLGGDVCSEPSCRAPLPAGASTCAACKGEIAGRIDEACDHWSALADVRRELAAHEASPPAYRRPPRAAKKGKGAPSG
jgi:hypothetical protein